MINKELYRVPTSPADLAMLLEAGVEFKTPASSRVWYDKDNPCPFRFDEMELQDYWSEFAAMKPVRPKPHWSDKASEDNPIPCYVWDKLRKPKPGMRYVISPRSEQGYITGSHVHWENAEPIREEDK